MTNRIACIGYQGEKGIEVMGLFLKCCVYDHTQFFTMGRLCVVSQPCGIAMVAPFRILYHRELVLCTDQVAEPCDGSARTEEVAEFSAAVQRDRVP